MVKYFILKIYLNTYCKNYFKKLTWKQHHVNDISATSNGENALLFKIRKFTNDKVLKI